MSGIMPSVNAESMAVPAGAGMALPEQPQSAHIAVAVPVEVALRVAVYLVLPVAMIVVGAVQLGRCSEQSALSWWLFVAGLLLLYRSVPACVYAGLNSVVPMRSRCGRRARPYAKPSGDWAIVLLLHLLHTTVGFFLVLFVQPSASDSDPSSASHCYWPLYVTALTAVLVTVMVLVFCGCVAVLWLCYGRQPPVEGVGLWPSVDSIDPTLTFNWTDGDARGTDAARTTETARATGAARAAETARGTEAGRVTEASRG